MKERNEIVTYLNQVRYKNNVFSLERKEKLKWTKSSLYSAVAVKNWVRDRPWLRERCLLLVAILTPEGRWLCPVKATIPGRNKASLQYPFRRNK